MSSDAGKRDRPYHHGNLRRALLDSAAEALSEHGIAALSLRDVARRAGVSHAAPAHHFGNKPGLLAAMATDGFTRFADALAAAPDLEGVGLAYIRFASASPTVFELMFRPDVLDRTNAELTAASESAYQVLADRAAAAAQASTKVDPNALAITTWSVAHGFATLWLHGKFDNAPTDDPTDLALIALRTSIAVLGR